LCFPFANDLLRLLALYCLLLAVSGCTQRPSCDLVKVAEAPLQSRGRPFAVATSINGHSLNMVVDTGSAKSMLVDTTMRGLGIRQDGRTYTVLVGLTGGSPRADANIDSISLGGAALSVDRMSVNSFGNMPDVDGVLGLDVLGKFDLDIDAPHRTLRLYRAQRCDIADLPWTEPSVAIAGVSATGSWLEMPIDIDGVVGSAVVDTGASYTMIMRRMMRRLGLTEQQLANDQTVTGHMIAGEDAAPRVHRFATIRLGPVVAHNVSVLVLTKEPPGLGGGRRFSDGVIGQDVLRQRRVWFSLTSGQLYMSGRTGTN
jgi:predicted aspartyl protease